MQNDPFQLGQKAPSALDKRIQRASGTALWLNDIESLYLVWHCIEDTRVKIRHPRWLLNTRVDEHF